MIANKSYLFNTELKPVRIYGFDGDDTLFLTVDASITEGHEASVTPTEHPVEFGANITDHIIINPRTFILEGRISVIPSREDQDIVAGSGDRPRQAWKAMKKLMFERRFAIVETNLERYENVVLQSLTTDQDWQRAHVIDFEATFAEIFVVDAPITRIETEQGTILDDSEIEQPSREALEQAAKTRFSVKQVEAPDNRSDKAKFFDAIGLPESERF